MSLLGIGTTDGAQLSRTMVRHGESRVDQARRAASMLEGVFVRQLFKVMRKTVPDSGLLGGKFSRSIYQEMLDSTFADGIAKDGGLGLGEHLAWQLGGAKGALPVAATGGGRALPLPNPLLHAELRARLSGAAEGQPATRAATAAAGVAAFRQVQQSDPAYRAPDRPEPVKISDPDGKLFWPARSGAVGAMRADGGVVAKAGSRVVAAGSGRVVQVGQGAAVIDHGGGRRSIYRGLGEVMARPGDLVLRGQELGRLGADGQFNFSVREGDHRLSRSEVLGLIR